MNWKDFLLEVVAPLMVCFYLFVAAQSPCTNQPGVTETPQNANPAWDTDGDTISNAVELNSANDYLDLDTAVWDANPTISHLCPCSGSIINALNLVNNGTGYWHNPGDDAIDTDDWGVLALINMIEGAGRRWYAEGQTPPRLTVNDLSRGNAATQQFGGYFSPHSCHQNGLEVDVRYVRKDNQEAGLDIAGADSAQYDTTATCALITYLLANADVDSIFIDTIHAGLIYPLFRHASGHSDHFHVRILDPDGTNNKKCREINQEER